MHAKNLENQYTGNTTWISRERSSLADAVIFPPCAVTIAFATGVRRKSGTRFMVNEYVHITYDAAGAPISMYYSTDGETYYYVLNQQGDVIGLVDSDGSMVVEYAYDAWGKPIATTGSKVDTVGAINPLRYRGYIYDTETGLYYVISRYYNPEIGRFISVGTPEVLLEDEDNILHYNLYAYCYNNPVNMVDYAGESPSSILGAIAGGIGGAALGALIAKELGLKGAKKAALIAAAAVGGAALGTFLGPYVAKLGSKLAAKLGVKSAIKISSSNLWKRSAKHIFSKAHIRDGIMKLGGLQKSIFNKIYKVVKQNLPNAVNGSNQIHTTINGTKVTIRFYVSNGQVQSMDAFTGWASRIIGKLL